MLNDIECCYRFAIDQSGVLYPSTEFAMKAASAELKGLMCFIEAGIENLAFPLMALIGNIINSFFSFFSFF